MTRAQAAEAVTKCVIQAASFRAFAFDYAGEPPIAEIYTKLAAVMEEGVRNLGRIANGAGE